MKVFAMPLIFLVLFTGCTINTRHLKAAEKFCEDHGGIYDIRIDVYSVTGHCKDGTLFTDLVVD